MSIVFVYDTQKCQSEADDPMSAVVYFHPSWVSDVHKLTLCGQLMGVSHFLELNFRAAKTIALQSGRFILKTFGRFVLVCSILILIDKEAIVSPSLAENHEYCTC